MNLPATKKPRQSRRTAWVHNAGIPGQSAKDARLLANTTPPDEELWQCYVVPDMRAHTPLSLCPRKPLSETGRLWFGQNDNGFDFQRNGVSIGAQATRLFSRSNGPGGSEVEPSYKLGRGIRWWDEHYQAVADYEPQYQLLEQLMRWSGAIDWLTSTGHRTLPQLPDSQIHSGLRFADWYATHNQLRERAPLTLVTPPSANQEAVLPTPSATTKDCAGLLGISGGVSLANGFTRDGALRSGEARLPPAVRRAGLTDPNATSVDPGTGSGRITKVTVNDIGQVTDRVSQILRHGQDVASVETVGQPRGSIPFGQARLAETGQRSLTTEFRSDNQDLIYDTVDNGTPVASVTAHQIPSSGVRQTDINLRYDLGRSLKKLAAMLPRNGARAPDPASDVRYSYPTSDGHTVVRLPEAWVEYGRGPVSRAGLTIELAMHGAGTVTMGVVTPARLSKRDVDALEVTQQARDDTFGNVRAHVPPTAAIYRGDIASVVGAEPAASLPAPIPTDARVRYRVVQATGNGSTPGPISSERRTWSLVSTGGAVGAGNPGGGKSGGGAGGSGAKPDRSVALIDIIVVCPEQEQPPSRQQDDSDEVCG